MSWGKGLSIVIIGFIVIMLGMVYISFQQTNEMIEDNYYDRELKYQEVINAKNRLEPFKKSFGKTVILVAIKCLRMIAQMPSPSFLI